MGKFLLKKHYRLKLLSPLHIGGSERIPFYTLVCLNGKCYVLDEFKLGEVLYRKGKQVVDQFVQFAGRERARMTDFLETIMGRDRSKWIPFLEDAKAYSAKAYAAPRRELHPFIRDSLYRPYVPGTSIKGALRTAVMYVMLKRMDEVERHRLLVDFVERKLNEVKRDIRSGQRRFLRRQELWFDQELETSLMWKYFFDEAVGRFDPHSDIFRAVKVSDTQPLEPDSAVIEEVDVYNRGYATGIKIYVETLPAGTELNFAITYDMKLLERFRTHTKEKFGMPMSEIVGFLTEPIRTLAEFTKDLLDYERNRIKGGFTYHFTDEPNISLGWGGGLLSKTVDLLLPEGMRAELLNLFKRRRPYQPAPSSRRLTQNKRPLGWGELRRCDDERFISR